MQPFEQPTIEASCVQLGELLIDLDGSLIHYPNGRDTSLTVRERDLLRALIHARGRLLSSADLGLEAWHAPAHSFPPQAIRKCICYLRRKLGNRAAIQTVRNVGYRLTVLPDR